jgi:TRAP-type C4-dicarboxylate transport system substrate-binding protein
MRFFSKGPVRTPDDLKKTKLFALGDSPPFIELLKSAGFDPVPLETTDIVPMLDTGLITSVPMPPFVALASQVYSRAPHMLELNWAPLTGALVIRKKVWEKTAPEARAALLEAATETGKQNKEKGRSESDKAVAVMKQRGLKVQTVSAELEAEWRRTAELAYPKIRGIVVPEEIFDRVVQLLRERRAAEGGAKP